MFTDNLLEEKSEGKSSADKEEQPVDEVPKRMKKADGSTPSKGKVSSLQPPGCTLGAVGPV